MNEQATRPELPTGYYLENFNIVLEFVARHHTRVLNQVELDFLSAFPTLSIEARYLYVRLISRKGPVFRSDKLSYAEIASIQDSAGELQEAGFLLIDPEVALEDLGRLLLKSELLQLFPHELTDHSKKRKPELLEILQEALGAGSLNIELPFAIYKPQKQEVIEVFRLLFFGNLWQDFTEFVLQDLGLTRYERYVIRPEDSIFRNRNSIEWYIMIHAMSELVYQIQEEQAYHRYADILEDLPGPLDQPRLERHRSRLINTMARDYERIGEYSLALNLFESSSEVPARERRLRMLTKLGKVEEARKLCKQMLKRPMDEEESEVAGRFQLKLEGEKAKRHLDSEFQHRRIDLPEHEQVEMAVLEHLSSATHKVYYVENALMLGLFGLVFWDVVFMPLPGAFFNHFQSGPADLFTPAFYPQRESEFKQRFREFENSSDPGAALLETYLDKVGISNHLVHWSILSEELVTLACDHIPGSHLRSIFQRLCFDLRNNRSGFPDLIMFDTENGSYRMIEVKGPGDRLQSNQKRWLRHFESQIIPYEVVYVNWTS